MGTNRNSECFLKNVPWVGKRLSYRPARLHRRGGTHSLESISGLLKSLKIRAQGPSLRQAGVLKIHLTPLKLCFTPNSSVSVSISTKCKDKLYLFQYALKNTENYDIYETDEKDKALLWGKVQKLQIFQLLYNLKVGPESGPATKRCRSITLTILQKNVLKGHLPDRMAYSKSVSIKFLKKDLSHKHTQQCFPVGRRRRRLILLLSHLESGGRKMFFLKLSLNKFFLTKIPATWRVVVGKCSFLNFCLTIIFSRKYQPPREWWYENVLS